jgi:DNA-binding MarR family transcriptional regulator
MPDTTTELWFRLLNEVGIIEQLARTRFEARLPPGFVLAQFTVLNHLIRVKDGQTPLALARAFQVPKTSMTHSLAVLERARLVRLEANPGDGRSKQVWITDAGRVFRNNAIAALSEDIGPIAGAIPQAEIATLLPGLERLRKVLDDARNTDDQTPR